MLRSTISHATSERVLARGFYRSLTVDIAVGGRRRLVLRGRGCGSVLELTAFFILFLTLSLEFFAAFLA